MEVVSSTVVDGQTHLTDNIFLSTKGIEAEDSPARLLDP